MGNSNKIKENAKGPYFTLSCFLPVLLMSVTVSNYFESLNFCGYGNIECGKIYSSQRIIIRYMATSLTRQKSWVGVHPCNDLAPTPFVRSQLVYYLPQGDLQTPR